MLLPALAGAYPAEVPRTGQTGCYADNGTEIDCAGTGQDGDWLAGTPWPVSRFSERADGTIADSFTGLVWAKNPNLLGTDDADNDTDDVSGDGLVIWQHALDYIKKLNRENYMNHADWRLPNVHELESLVHAGSANPAIPANTFSAPPTNVYWSSTSREGNTNYAWCVGMVDGDVNYDIKTYYYSVWPVRSGQCGIVSSIVCLPKTGQQTCTGTNGSPVACGGTGQDGHLQAGVAWPSPRFITVGDEVTDNLTGLVWAKDANIMPGRDNGWDNDDTANDGRVTFEHALDYIEKLNSENYQTRSDWRLPNRRELRSLVDYGLAGPALPSGHPFSQVQPSNYYWSSTSKTGLTDYAWLVGMDCGDVLYKNKAYDGYVWPVRAGQFYTTTTTSVAPTTTSTTATTVAATTTTPAPSSTTTSAGGGMSSTTTTAQCPVRKALGDDVRSIAQLQAFRDTTLAQSALGRRVIEMYYKYAGNIDAALERSPALQTVMRWILEAIASMAGGKEEYAGRRASL
jgi:hypothetical protein